MNKFLLLMLCSILIAACSPSSDTPAELASKPEKSAPSIIADVVYTNGRIYTVNKGQPWVEAVAIRDGKFLVVGDNEAVAAVTGDTTDVHDLGGAFAMPGIGDSHIHPALVMPKRAFCGLLASNSKHRGLITPSKRGKGNAPAQTQ
ncbi:MAG: hypothetical protein OEU84_15430, partial [Xanthomonadales bacterium]|nr:hypothetical protein [Xanthomonadales bacterium]